MNSCYPFALSIGIRIGHAKTVYANGFDYFSLKNICLCDVPKNFGIESVIIEQHYKLDFNRLNFY